MSQHYSQPDREDDPYALPDLEVFQLTAREVAGPQLVPIAEDTIMTLTDIFRPIRKRTKTAYVKLFDHPNYLFGRGSRTMIFPNGEREIWIGNADGTAKFRIRASDGPAGFGVTITACVGTLATDAHILNRADYTTQIREDVREVTMISPYLDEYSQQFKHWYNSDARDEQGNKTVPHPDVLGLQPRVQPMEKID